MKKNKSTIRKKQTILGILLIVSLIANGVLIGIYIPMSKQQNLTWSNSTAHFAQVAHWLSIDTDRFTRNEKITQEQIDYVLQYGNFQLVNEQLESIGQLPYGNEIVPFEARQKVRILASYQHKVLQLMKKEIETEGEVSLTNIERIERIQEAWDKLIGTLSKEENKIDPFFPIFLKDQWTEVWRKAIIAFEKVELLPLPK